MPNLFVKCELTGEVIPEAEAEQRGYALTRSYSPAAVKIVDEYQASLMAVAVEVRKLYTGKREQLKAAIRAVHPESRFPDDPS